MPSRSPDAVNPLKSIGAGRLLARTPAYREGDIGCAALPCLLAAPRRAGGRAAPGGRAAAAARLLAPISVDRPTRTLFNEAVLIYSNAVRRQHGRRAAPRPGPVARSGRACAQHGAAPHPQPRAAGARPARPVAADAPPVARVPQGGGEHRDGQGLPAARPADLDELARAAASPTATPSSRCRSTPTRASPSRWWRAGSPRPSTAPRCSRRATSGSAPGSGVDPPGRPAATSTWCRTSPTDAQPPRPGCRRGRRGGGRSTRCGHPARPAGRTERVWK